MLKAASLLSDHPINKCILKPALFEPVARLLSNCGMGEDEIGRAISPILAGIKEGKTVVYDALEQKWGDAVELGVLDSTPAVLEAIRNSISIASLLGTLGGTVVFARDHELERSEASATREWNRNANGNEADERV